MSHGPSYDPLCGKCNTQCRSGEVEATAYGWTCLPCRQEIRRKDKDARIRELEALLQRESRARLALERGLERIAATRWKRVDSAEVALMAREIIAGQWQGESDGTAQMEEG